MDITRSGLFIGLLALFHLTFFVSALGGDFYRPLFPEGTIQDAKSLDFTQVPNGARTWLNGGSIKGAPSTVPRVLTPNVYHPVTTIVLGGALQFVDLKTSYTLYTLVKLLLSVLLLVYLVVVYRESKWFVWACSIFLGYWVSAVDVECGQYQFLLVFCTWCLLEGNAKNWSTFPTTIWFFLGLMIKPIGLIWIPAFIWNKKRVAATLSIAMFAVLTLIVSLAPSIQDGDFYVSNILEQSESHDINPATVEDPIYTLEALLQYFELPEAFRIVIKWGSLIGLVVILATSRVSFFSSLFLLTGYFLCFFSLVFVYHYTILIPFLVLGALNYTEFRSIPVLIASAVLALPTPYVLLAETNLFGSRHWWLREGRANLVDILFYVVPLIILMGSVLWSTLRSEPEAEPSRIASEP